MRRDLLGSAAAIVGVAVVGGWTSMAQAADTECFVSADLDFTIQNEMRNSLPSLRNRRPEAYRWPEPVGTVAP